MITEAKVMNLSEEEMKFIGTKTISLESKTMLRRMVEHNAFSCMSFKVMVEKAYKRYDNWGNIIVKEVENDSHGKRGDSLTFCVYACDKASISFTYGPSRFEESLILREKLGAYADIVWDIEDRKQCEVLSIEVKDKQFYMLEFVLSFVGVDINIMYRNE